MDTEGEGFKSTFLIVMGVMVILFVIIFILANMLSGASEEAIKSTDAYKTKQTEQITERVMKVGSVATFDPNAKPKVRSGEEIYTAVCAACHNTGVLNAPKVGTGADWTARLTGGFDALVTSSITGKGAMPPKGGDASLSDVEMQKVVAYMLTKTGLDAPDVGGSEAASAAPATVIEQAPAPTPTTASASVSQAAETVPNVAAAVTATAATATAAVANTAGNVVNAMTGQTAKPAAATEVVATPKAAAGGNNDKGKSIYKTACFACHDSGVAGAPKLGDKPAWAARLATGMDAMVKIALNGKGGMPPKGGRVDLSTADIEAAVAFMAAEAQ